METIYYVTAVVDFFNEDGVLEIIKGKSYEVDCDDEYKAGFIVTETGNEAFILFDNARSCAWQDGESWIVKSGTRIFN